MSKAPTDPEELDRFILLTCDGRGVKAKQEALDRVVQRATLRAVDKAFSERRAEEDYQRGQAEIEKSYGRP